ncbi:hypothetical protein HY857_00950 [Candidatus Saccharibacteria bacterium]|nr:hypothetical protein [Candidatus Saccharibacteria bacterium]
MILKVVKELSIPAEYHRSNIPAAVLQIFGLESNTRHTLALTRLRGVETDEGWEVVANPALEDEVGTDVVFGRVLLAATYPELVLPEAEEWVRDSKATVWMPGHVKVESVGKYAVRGLVLVRTKDLNASAQNA